LICDCTRWRNRQYGSIPKWIDDYFDLCMHSYSLNTCKNDAEQCKGREFLL
jgi:hypothetical protein